MQSQNGLTNDVKVSEVDISGGSSYTESVRTHDEATFTLLTSKVVSGTRLTRV